MDYKDFALAIAAASFAIGQRGNGKDKAESAPHANGEQPNWLYSIP